MSEQRKHQPFEYDPYDGASVPNEVARLRRIVEAQGSALLHWRRAYDKAAAEGAAAEREACAEIADGFAADPDRLKIARGVADLIAEAIRARGKGAA